LSANQSDALHVKESGHTVPRLAHVLPRVEGESVSGARSCSRIAMIWSDLETAAPEIARLDKERLDQEGVALDDPRRSIRR
jgi:hypothetical protein